MVDPSGLDGDDDDTSFLGLMSSYGKGVVKGIIGGAVGTIRLPIDLIRHPVSTVGGIGSYLKMRAETMAQVAMHPSQAKEALTDAIITLGPNRAMEILGDAGGQVIFYDALTRVVKGIRDGQEYRPTKNWRVAPYGNRTSHPTGRYPHYHRKVPDPRSPGDSLPGQGMKRHRPWDTKPQDKVWWDRF